jgi:hypothetical protein
MSNQSRHDHTANALAIQRLEQIKQQLNLTPSSMSIEAPQDMARERASASFDIQALSHFWIGGEKKYNDRVNARVRSQRTKRYLLLSLEKSF